MTGYSHDRSARRSATGVPRTESPSALSYHLRALARWKFVEEAEGGVGRERPWRATASRIEFGSDGLESLRPHQPDVRIPVARKTEAILAVIEELKRADYTFVTMREAAASFQ